MSLAGISTGVPLGVACASQLVTGADAALLVAPKGDFYAELDRMELARPTAQAVPLGGETFSHPAAALEAEMEDLRAALNASKMPKDELERILAAHRAERQKLQAFAEIVDSRRQAAANAGQDPDEKPLRTPPFPKITIVKGLPAEFADYLEGSIAWHNPTLADKTLARAAWERLLAWPAEERRFKSTWAAFMLGKSYEKADPDKAATCYQQVRELKRKGFADALGLAAASLGLEARINLKQKQFEKALELYADQMAAGDPTAAESLRMASRAALHADDKTLQALAQNSKIRRIMTAYVIAHPPYWDPFGTEAQPTGQTLTGKWLNAVEAVVVKDAEAAEELALAAYQNHDMDLAQRWIKRAPGSPVAQWLQAKLLLRAGKVQAAATLMSKVAALFPLQPHGTNSPAPRGLKDTLSMCNCGTPAERQVHGELGVFRLAHGDFVQALDSLLNAGFWVEAAYVAERVLTVDELRNYVDSLWPAVSYRQIQDEDAEYGPDEASPAKLREKIRYLLARRLTRAFRSDEAREYYPDEWLGAFDALVRALKTGWDETLPATNRAVALFESAAITRTNGLQLIGTEVDPDWHACGGNCEGSVAQNRLTNIPGSALTASQEEARRAKQHHADPEQRFHYRYQAAALAWEAAKLLPNDSDQTAFILWQAGTWLKARDPLTANLFYKALVRRNRHTALGVEADRRRWFPQVDENGNIIHHGQTTSEPETAPEPREPESEPQPEEQPAAELVDTVDADVDLMELLSIETQTIENGEAGTPIEPVEGYDYIIQKGDTLAGIIAGFAEAGLAVTLSDVLNANAGLDPSKLRIGQKLFIPAPREE